MKISFHRSERPLLRLVPVAAAGLVLILGCSGPDEGGEPGPDGETGGDSGSTGGSGMATGGGSSTGGGPGATGGSMGQGDGFPTSADVRAEGWAGFLMMGWGPLPDYIEFREEGDALLNAGVVVAKDAASGIEYTYTPREDGSGYDMLKTMGDAPAGGESFTVTAEGGTVSAFSGTLALPLAPYLTSHTAAAAGDVAEVTVSRSTDLVLTWDSRGTSEAIWLLDSTLTHGWMFDATSGGATISSAELGAVPAGTKLTPFGVNLSEVETPQGPVELWGQFYMVTSDTKKRVDFVLQ